MAQQYFDEEKFVFFNKLGIENQEELEKWEYGHTEIRMRELLENPKLIKTQSFNLDRQKEIHLIYLVIFMNGQEKSVPFL